MRKLLALREWLTIPDAATYLADALLEPVRDSDILRLGLDGLIAVSVLFVNNTWAWVGDLHNGDLTYDEFGGIRLERRSSEPELIDGVWNLISAAAGEIELLRREQRLIGGPEVDLFSGSGIFIARPDRSAWAELAELDVRGLKVEVSPEIVAQGLPLVKTTYRYRSTHELPPDAVLVVTPDSLEAFVSALNDVEVGSPEIDERSDGDEVKRNALVAKFSRVWPTIDRDLRDAATNELTEAAHGSKHGFWKVTPALGWARARGKLISEGSGPAFAGFPPTSLR